MTYEEWLARLGRGLARKFPGHIKFESWDDWHAYFDAGYSPKQAFIESHTQG